ncbi:MAG TPA: acyl-CoA dehydrogenase family protein [Candidatus Thermoplasmatota archaeon]|nr:acyl-CoA dehydrogenase family protein [Candidatus Thermoplasmatota archaeon]
MVHLALTEEQRAIRDLAHAFAEKEIRPVAAKADKTKEFPWPTVRRMGELGFLGVNVPEQYGGAGADAVSFALVTEEIAWGDATHMGAFGANNSLTCAPILRFGTEEQKQKFLVPLASGKWLGAYSLSEPSAGSDAAALKTTARREGDVYVLNGVKSWVTSGSIADLVLVYATIDPALGSRGVTAFLVPKGTRGMTAGKVEDKMGMRASPTSELVFEDCAVPAENVLGRPGEGFKIALSTLDGGRIMSAMGATGIARAALEDAIGYAKTREAFGKPIANHQAIQHMIADMATWIDAGRLLALKAAQLRDRGERYTMEASVAKLLATERATQVCLRAVQILGGAGYTREFAVERYLRDVKVFEIFEGTSEIQRLVIARQLGLHA